MKKSEKKRMDQILTVLLKQGVVTDVFPGAVAVVSRGKGSQRRRSFACAGIMDKSFPDEKINLESVFDLASLTKALATSLIVYSLINENKLKITDKLEIFFGEMLPDDKREIPISLLLSHAAGLISYEPYFASCEPIASVENKEKLLKSILSQPLAYRPGSSCVYSDFGFILLGVIIEKVTGESLEYNFEKYITQPARLSRDIFYLPTEKKLPDRHIFAATEDCPWRGKVMRAEVHDEHCWLMGGLSGHAGLFGRARGVTMLCEQIFDEWLQQGKKYAWSSMLQQGLQRQHKEHTWCLGFDTPSTGISSGGKYIVPESVGHLGYTGTSFWIDPSRELVMVLLTNRVHPSRENTKIREFRPCFHNSVIKAIDRE